MRSHKTLLSTLIVTLYASLGFSSLAEAQISNVKPGSLSITKADDKTAIIEARFATAQKEKKVSIIVGRDENIFTDDGTGNDAKAGDGVFTATVAFDFDA